LTIKRTIERQSTDRKKETREQKGKERENEIKKPK
jgi:hypothetical protein